MKTILVDTSSLLYAVKNKVDLFAELKRRCDFPFRVAVVSGVVGELKKLARLGKEKRAAMLVLALLKEKELPIIPENIPEKDKTSENRTVDDLLAHHSRKGDLILTQDRELKRRLTRPYLTIRQGKYVMVCC